MPIATLSIVCMWGFAVYLTVVSIAFFWMFFVAFGFSAAFYDWVGKDLRRGARAEAMLECVKTKPVGECAMLMNSLYPRESD